MKRLLFFLLLISFRQGIGQTFVLIPDPNFATYLQGLIPAAMNGNSLNTTHTLVTTSTQTINVPFQSISNLSGIQYFLSLTYLNCNNNYSLSTLPTLPNSLTYLNCSSNSLTTLPVLPASLQTLWCYLNSLTTLPALPNSLQTLSCYNNSFTSLPALPNSLIYLDCSNNFLTTLPALPNSLQTLYCQSNSLTTLPALPNSLTYLSCAVNSLTSLPVLAASLQTLVCGFNYLTTLPALPNSLQTLACYSNNIACFPIFPNSISVIYLNFNPYTCLPNYVLPAMNAYTATPLCAPGNTNGCAFITDMEKLKQQNNQVIAYPNPTKGQLFIESTTTEKQTMKLFDLNGRLLFIEEFIGKINIDLTNLNEGVYNLTVKRGDNLLNKKLVIIR